MSAAESIGSRADINIEEAIYRVKPLDPYLCNESLRLNLQLQVRASFAQLFGRGILLTFRRQGSSADMRVNSDGFKFIVLLDLNLMPIRTAVYNFFSDFSNADAVPKVSSINLMYITFLSVLSSHQIANGELLVMPRTRDR